MTESEGVRSAIVVEGGGMRGIFSPGVLDALHEAGVAPFDVAIGCSAGACNLASYLAAQHGRNRRCYTTQMVRSQFLSGRRFLRGGHWLDLDYLWDAFAREDPLDVDAAVRGPTALVVAATSVDGGTATYLEPSAAQLLGALRASSAVPILYRTFVEVAGCAYTDGGVTAAVPAQEAYRRGARRILVIRSRPVDYVKDSKIEPLLGGLLLRRKPLLARAIREAPAVYNRAVSFLRSPPADCYVQQVAPARKLRTGRTTRDVRTLERDYELGRLAGLEAACVWRSNESASLTRPWRASESPSARRPNGSKPTAST